MKEFKSSMFGKLYIVVNIFGDFILRKFLFFLNGHALFNANTKFHQHQNRMESYKFVNRNFTHPICMPLTRVDGHNQISDLWTKHLT